MDLSIVIGKVCSVIAAALGIGIVAIYWSDIKRAIRAAQKRYAASVLMRSRRYKYIPADAKKRIALEFLDENGLIVERRKAE